MIFVQKTGLIQLKLRKEIKKEKSFSNLKNKRQEQENQIEKRKYFKPNKNIR